MIKETHVALQYDVIVEIIQFSIPITTMKNFKQRYRLLVEYLVAPKI